jgi:2'-hydroxyisoflavone reductase
VRVLVLGGTVFLGRHVVDAALGRGHQVTLFNRGRSNPDLFPEAELLVGDREGDLSALEGHSFDAVVDLSGFLPRQVRSVIERLGSEIPHYSFISSISVYPMGQLDKSENAPVVELEDPASEDVDSHYGGLKALCEQEADALLPGRVLNVRSGLIAGPNDPTNRFTYWPVRAARGGEILAPGDPDLPVQFVDVRDEAAWILEMGERGSTGTFNVTGPATPLTMGALLDLCLSEAPEGSSLCWVSEEYLREQRVAPWTELPLWVPAELAGIHAAPIGHALSAGLRHRPVRETIAETREWALRAGRTAPQVDAGGRLRTPAGMPAQREAELLRLWHEKLD